MINKKIIIAFFLMLFIFPSYVIASAEELKSKNLINKWFSAIGASKVMLYFENNIVSKVYDIIWPRLFGNELASNQYQILGKEAQAALGIPKKYHVPIKKFNYLMAKFFKNGALTIPGSIYVNENQLDGESYGSRCCMLFHEAAHRKYNDGTCGLMANSCIAGLFIMLTYKLLTYPLPQKYVIWEKIRYQITICSMLCLYIAALVKYSKFIERRADIDSLFAVKCPSCILEESDARRYLFEVINHLIKDHGYLWSKDLNQIAEYLKSENNLCHYHKDKIMNEIVAFSHKCFQNL